MKITADTPQTELIRLTDRAIHKQLLGALPVSVQGLRTMLLFVMFPGLVFGFRRGLFLTALVAAAMAAVVFYGKADWSIILTKSYFIWGALTALGVSISVVFAAFRRSKTVKKYLPATGPVPGLAVLDLPQMAPMQIQRQGDDFIAQISLNIKQTGICVLLVDMESYGWAKPMRTTDGKEACFFDWSGGKKPTQAICAYRFEAGVQTLWMPLSMDLSDRLDRKRPRILITQINAI